MRHAISVDRVCIQDLVDSRGLDFVHKLDKLVIFRWRWIVPNLEMRGVGFSTYSKAGMRGIVQHSIHTTSSENRGIIILMRNDLLSVVIE